MEFIPRPLVSTTEEALAHIKVLNDAIDANRDINWAVTEKGKNICIGVITSYSIHYTKLYEQWMLLIF